MPKTQKTIFLTLFFIFLFFGSKALAAACNKPPAWNTAGSCSLDIYYEDPSGGSNLAGCYYNIQSGASPTCPSNGTWNSACNCSGLASTTCPVTVSIGPTGNCNTNGTGACKVCSKATDTAGNVGYGEQSLNIDFAAPTVSVTGAPVSWQNSDATASVSCSDGHSGCDATTYKLKTYTSNPGACSTTYTDYTLTPPQTISSHSWLCGAAKDNVGNTGFSTPVEFKVDKTKPVSQITVPEAGSTQTANFNVTVSDTDTGGSGINTGACYYRTYDSGVGWTRDWTLRTCNSTQLITVGSGKDCQTSGGTCTVYVYSYDNAGNQSDINLRSFPIESGEGITCSVSVPSTGLVNQWILINVSGSQGTIAGVRFASDNILNGVREGSWDPPEPNYYDWNVSSGNWSASTKTMKWSFAATGNYEVWAEVKDGAGNTRSCYDTILIFECYPGQTTTCTSPQGCSHTLTCQPDGTWPSCPTDVCTAGTQYSILCPCPAVDGCVGNDYYDYPAYGDCNSFCNCDVGTALGQPCAPAIYLNDPRCVDQDQCNSDADCDDGNPCTNNWCERPAESDSICRRENLTEGISCGICKKCDGSGNCINRPDGYDTSECGAGCQRCLAGSCGDYHLACGGSETSCECRGDSCIDCSDYYGVVCGYQGICHCGPAEKPVWSCSNRKCQCICQYDPVCEWEPDEYPEIIISPSFQEGNPGDELSYEVTIINPSEEEVTLTITASVPSGWDYWLDTLGMVEVTIGPGQSAKIPLRVKSPAEGVPSGEYIISITAQNENFGTGYAKYEIPNQRPYKPTPSSEYPGGVSWNHCTGFQALSIPTFHWTYSDPEGNPQASYQIRIKNSSIFPAEPTSDEFTDSKDSLSHSYTPSSTPWGDWMDWNTNYWWVVKVKDNQGNWSEWSDPTLFTTPLHAAPWPDFSLSKERVAQNEVVTAIDASKCYTFPGNAEVNCRDLVGTSYQWDFDYDGSFNPVKTTKGNTTWVYTDLGEHTVVLRIADDIAQCYSDAKTLTVTLPLPKWKEIAPF